MALRDLDGRREALGPVVPDPGRCSGWKPLDEPLQGHLLHNLLWAVPLRGQPPPRLVPQLLGVCEGTIAFRERKGPEPAAVLFRV